jgi:hypothetical protein
MAYGQSDIRAWLVPEPENPADRNAVAVMVGVQNGRGIYKLGYLPKEAVGLASLRKPATVRVVNGDILGGRIVLSV